MIARCAGLILLVICAGCQSGAPLPEPNGPWEPLNGWIPPSEAEAATPVFAKLQVAPQMQPEPPPPPPPPRRLIP